MSCRLAPFTAWLVAAAAAAALPGAAPLPGAAQPAAGVLSANPETTRIIKDSTRKPVASSCRGGTSRRPVWA